MSKHIEINPAAILRHEQRWIHRLHCGLRQCRHKPDPRLRRELLRHRGLMAIARRELGRQS